MSTCTSPGGPKPRTKPRRRTNQMGLLGPGLDCPLPVRVYGRAQHGGDALPPTCPKCGSAWTAVRPCEAECLPCGVIWYLTRYELRA